MIVLDERAQPSMRETFSALLSTSTHVDMAVANMRLAGIDVRPGEVTALRRLRLVVGRLDADALLQTESRPLEQIRRLHTLASSGVLEVRAVPRFQWTPDFSVFDRAALIGAHYTELPYPIDGIALTCVVTDPGAMRRCARRFEEMWELGYDVLPVVIETLDELLAQPAPA
ncbi:MAG TPA: hypothetical protein VGC44_08340 [Longimicrobiales bacterium]